jgi:hypothetical protein
MVSETAPGESWDWSENYTPYEGCEEFVHLGNIMGVESYDWDQIDVFYNPPNGRFYWIEQSGCSCYGPWEVGMTVSDFNDGDAQQAVRAVRDYAKPGQYRDPIDDSLVNRIVAEIKEAQNGKA